MTGPAWLTVEDRLRLALEGLADGGILIVGEPAAPASPAPASPEPAASPGPRRGPLGRGLLRRRPKPPPSRYVQYLRTDAYLACECAGAAAFGGDLPLTAEQDEAIRRTGWRLPTDGSDAEPAPTYPNYHRTVPLAEPGEAARLGVGALAALGLHPDDLTWDRR